MSQPVKLSDKLVLDARLVAEMSERSIAGQIEFWARLGRAVEPLLNGDKAISLKKSGDMQSLSELIESVDKPKGQRRLLEYLNSLPYPHYEALPGNETLVVRIDSSGERTIGKFVNKQFQAVKLNHSTSKSKTSKAPASRKAKGR